MIFHVMIISIQCAVVAAFLILWYFWVKGKLRASTFLEDEEHFLFPFRYFSWILVAVIVVTCLAQVHFVRVSSTVHERLAGLQGLYTRQEIQARSMGDMKEMIKKLRDDMHMNFRGLRAQIAESSSAAAAQSTAERQATQTPPLQRPTRLGVSVSRVDTQKNEFAGEARAASSQDFARSVPAAKPGPRQAESADLFMHLSREGRILTDHLRVRNRPVKNASVVEKLMSGQQVKVTGKRLSGNRIWYRVVTPTGRAGWVDYRYIKLGGNA